VRQACRKLIRVSGATNFVLISTTVQQLQQCKYAGANLPPLARCRCTSSKYRADTGL